MNAPTAFNAFRWLIWDTFRQSAASRIFWVILAATGLCVLFCLSVSVEGGAPAHIEGENELYGADGKLLSDPTRQRGELSLAFGAIRTPLFRTGEAEVQLILALLGKWVAGAGGLLLALIWTAGFLPDFLQPSSAAILLAKPMPRWGLLVGKFLGVLAFVAAQATLFFVGTWLALGLGTGFWQWSYLAGVPLFVVNFAGVYGFSVLLATWTRNTIACLFGSILFWLVCVGVNFGRHATVAWAALAPDMPGIPSSFRYILEVGYWLLPKPADLIMLLDKALHASDHFGKVTEFDYVERHGQFFPELSILTSLIFTAGILMIAVRKLRTCEY
jgi:ABC-type transport system involved in multi-copper enzyme maturation permease subunit